MVEQTTTTVILRTVITDPHLSARSHTMTQVERRARLRTIPKPRKWLTNEVRNRIQVWGLPGLWSLLVVSEFSRLPLVVSVGSRPCDFAQGDMVGVILRSEVRNRIQVWGLPGLWSLLVVSEFGRLPLVVSVGSRPCDFAQGDMVGVILRSEATRRIQVWGLPGLWSLLVVSEFSRLPLVVSVGSRPCDFAQGDMVGVILRSEATRRIQNSHYPRGRPPVVIDHHPPVNRNQPRLVDRTVNPSLGRS